MRALFFSPYSIISRHVKPEIDLMTYLISNDWSIDVIQCNGLMSDFCTSMASMGLEPTSSDWQKKLVCLGCNASRKALQKSEFGANFHVIERWSNLIPNALIDSQIISLTQDNWIAHEYQGIQIGRLAAVDLLMHYKINSSQIPDYLWKIYLQQVKICYQTYFSSIGFLRELKPDRVIIYNTLFGVNRVVQQVSESFGIPCYSVHLGFQSKSDSNAMMLYRDDDEQLRISHTQEAISSISMPLAPAKVDESFKFFDVTLNALSHTVYSEAYKKNKPDETRRILQVKSNQPVILVPLASADERFALGLLNLPALRKPAQLFGNQNEWVKFILELAKNNREWQFIIRPHPRMFPNHRERNSATESVALLDLISRASSNVHINLPSNHISLPGILQITDVVLGGTTSAGLEALAYGIPVITHNESLLFAYPAQIGSFARSEEEYVLQIKKLIVENWSVENMLRALRWMSFLDNSVSRTITSITQSSQGAPLVQLTDKWKIRFLRRFRVFQSLPKVLSLPIASVFQLRIINNWLTRDVKFTSDALAFSQTLTTLSPGLHKVTQNERHEANKEMDVLRINLKNLVKMLGSYDDPNCLSSKIERFIART